MGVRCMDWYGDRSLLVIDIALTCCALEVEAAQARVAMAARPVELAEVTADDRVAVVVSGTVTDAALPLVREIIELVPQAQVIAFGACASSGGPYWDSYAVTKGIGQVAEVAAYVPGCPPPPEALEHAFEQVKQA